MSEYINQCNVAIGEVARLRFNDVINDQEDFIIELICPVEFLPILSKCIQESYDGYQKHLVDEKAARETNKSLS